MMAMKYEKPKVNDLNLVNGTSLIIRIKNPIEKLTHPFKINMNGYSILSLFESDLPNDAIIKSVKHITSV